ncbi:helix-turn-helix domain-containing protein [Streptomyces lydicus]|uniref:helix-turn-helix domain-containing protein n=1 Tax=Streptomyces lydicus TaxID=47763 RepID=UPI0037B9A24A
MTSIVYRGVGPRIAYARRVANLTQAELARAANVALGTVRKIERNERGISGDLLDAVAAALDIDPARLLPDTERPDDRLHRTMPGLSAVLAEYEAPEDGPCRTPEALARAVQSVVAQRLGARYAHIARTAPALLAELCRCVHAAAPAERQTFARLLVDACRAADAVAYKCGARDLSARLIDLMRWAAGYAQDPALHFGAARALGSQVDEGVYAGTAFGRDSVRIHEVSVAVSLGDGQVGRALELAREWTPPGDLPAERRSGFYIELARAQLWSGSPDEAFASLKTARRIAPQHVREHRWVREDAGTLRRLKRSDAASLSAFAEWCHARG